MSQWPGNAQRERTTFGGLRRGQLMSRVRSTGNLTTERRLASLLRAAGGVGINIFPAALTSSGARPKSPFSLMDASGTATTAEGTLGQGRMRMRGETRSSVTRPETVASPVFFDNRAGQWYEFGSVVWPTILNVALLESEDGLRIGCQHDKAHHRIRRQIISTAFSNPALEANHIIFDNGWLAVAGIIGQAPTDAANSEVQS